MKLASRRRTLRVLFASAVVIAGCGSMHAAVDDAYSKNKQSGCAKSSMQVTGISPAYKDRLLYTWGCGNAFVYRYEAGPLSWIMPDVAKDDPSQVAISHLRCSKEQLTVRTDVRGIFIPDVDEVLDAKPPPAEDLVKVLAAETLIVSRQAEALVLSPDILPQRDANTPARARMLDRYHPFGDAPPLGFKMTDSLLDDFRVPADELYFAQGVQGCEGELEILCPAGRACRPVPWEPRGAVAIAAKKWKCSEKIDSLYKGAAGTSAGIYEIKGCGKSVQMVCPFPDRCYED